SVPVAPLAVDVDPDSQPLFIAERSVGHLRRQLTILLFLLRLDEDFRVCPTSVTVYDAKFVRELGMRLKKQRFEDTLVGFDLPLQPDILLRATTRLIRIR